MSQLRDLPLPIPSPSITLPAYVAPLHASLLTLGYVGSFYLSPTIRKLPKDDPRVMRSRLKMASGVTALGWLGTASLLWKGMSQNVHATIKIPQLLLALGLPFPLSVPTFLTSSWIPLQPSLWSFLSRHALPAIVLPLSLTMTLFAGPLYVEWLDDCLPLPTWLCRRKQHEKKDDNRTPSAWTKLKTWTSQWWNLYGLRNFIVGPVTEEIIWRSCILSIHFYSFNSTRNWLIFGTPLYFGIAHLHHAWETYRSRSADPATSPRSALKFAVLQSAFQFGYTTLFGWYANFLFLRTGSIIPPLLSHVFCNVMGFPNPAHAAVYFPDKKLSIYASHIAGMIGFGLGLFTLTRPELFGGSVFW